MFSAFESPLPVLLDLSRRYYKLKS